MIDPGICFFLLRTNAHSLLSGRPAASVRERISVASLLYDKVVIEDGKRIINAGASGAVEFWLPDQGRINRGFQTPRARAKAQKSGTTISISPTGSGQPPVEVLRTDDQLGWEPTFLPFKDELPRAFDWLEFESFGLTAEGEALAQQRARIDLENEALVSEASQFVRGVILKSLNEDLVIAGGSTISVDHRHGQLVRDRVRIGEAHAALGATAAEILVPKGLTWEEIDELRRTRGFREWQQLVRDIELAARESGGSLANEVIQEFSRRSKEASESVRATRQKGATAALAASVAATIVCGVAGVPWAAAGGAATAVQAGATALSKRDAEASEPWLSFDARLRG